MDLPDRNNPIPDGRSLSAYPERDKIILLYDKKVFVKK